MKATILILALILAGCMGNTVNFITVERKGTATIANHEDGKTTTATPVTTMTGLPK